MKKIYVTEREGQEEFFNDYLKLVNRDLTMEDVVSDNTDGIIRGNILEFKLNINDLNKVLFQAIKYLSARRIKGKEIQKNIVLISLNTTKAYVFNSADYLKEIEHVYFNSASVENEGFFIKNNDYLTLDYSEAADESKLIKILREEEYTKIDIDEDCVVGWAERFYNEVPGAKKHDFIGDLEGKVKILGEIRKPNHFAEFINPYQGQTNVKFQYLMDKLNDKFQKKNLGAFYTPELYVEKSIELLRQAIARVPEGNDYIILDRCAGTGNLEKLLTDEELSHCIVSTIEYYEYKVLVEILGDKVRDIVPPTEKDDTFNGGLVRGADAMCKEYVENPVIMQYVNDPKCTIILFENPPYSETTSIEHQKAGKGKESGAWKDNYVVKEMKKEIKGRASNDVANAFIWSAFKYYLRQDTDSYIVYSPIKYWKNQHIINKQFEKGFIFNRRQFHTTSDAAISCILWSNVDSKVESFPLDVFNIVNDELVTVAKDVLCKKVYTTVSSEFYSTYTSNEETSVWCNPDGLESTSRPNCKSYYSDNILSYLIADGNSLENAGLRNELIRQISYRSHGTYITKDNYLTTLPIFAAGFYVAQVNKWYYKAFLMRTADKHAIYMKHINDGTLNDFLLKTLFWTSLTHFSHIRSLDGSDERLYRNELCLDTTHGETIASAKLKEMNMTEEEVTLIKAWNILLNKAKETANYNPDYTYGLHQIEKELNTKYKNERNKTVFDYPELNGDITSIKKLLKAYYINNLADTLIEYEFVK